MVIGVAVASFALWQSLRAWEEQKADKLSDFSAAERQVEAMQQDARSVSDDPARWTQLEWAEIDLQVARLSLILFFTAKPFPLTAAEAAHLARWQREFAAFRGAHPLVPQDRSLRSNRDTI